MCCKTNKEIHCLELQRECTIHVLSESSSSRALTPALHEAPKVSAAHCDPTGDSKQPNVKTNDFDV